MNKNYTVHAHTPLRILGEPSLPVRNALRDLERDWYRVFGYPLLVLTEFTGENEGDELVLDCDNTLLPPSLRPVGYESHTLRISGRRFILAGADMRGTVYAIYAFSREILGVDPLWYWNDFTPARKTAVELSARYTLRVTSPTFRYRGWFINDEDILGGFFPNRTFDGVMSPEGFDCIMEALLRLGGNMIVPGSFAMPDEDVRRLAAARGLLLNDHHVTPLGLNMYRWPEDVPFSYSRGKEYLQECWKTCVDTLKGYEQVWTVSFRGKNDHPYWQEDPYAPEDDAGRAAEIEEAIRTEIDLIRAADPQAIICFNMYNEQAKFSRAGLISLPEDIIRVWPGSGCFDETAAVRTGPGDGVYFHMTGAARNRYTEYHSPQSVFESLYKYYAVGATSFCLFNVSNLRHLALSVAAGMDYLWNAAKYAATSPAAAAKRWLDTYLTTHYGAELLPDMRRLYRAFHGLTYHKRLPAGEAPTSRTCFGYVTGIFRDGREVMSDLKQNAMLQGISRALIAAPKEGISEDWLLDAAEFRRFLLKCRREFTNLSDLSEELKGRIPKQAKLIYLTQVLTQIQVLKLGNEAVISLCDALLAYGKSATVAAVCARAALRSLEDLISALHQAEYGRWATWYETERFGCFYFSRDIIHSACRVLEGRPERPVRYVGGYRNWLYFWDKLYEYQHGCAFPLLKEKE